MSEFAVVVSGLGKRYRIGRKASGSLRESIVNAFRRSDKEITDFWALKDVSFNLEQGRVLGMIGKNGAGKSTLLKTLSRITWPTSGRIEINGRVSSLLEVGTGFHPELTGRENVFLNGTILGMSRREVRSKFDEIVDFSGIERFIDTPVKRYSSGMYVRLAFAVAAHLDPEILIIDEVLAVGDADFQKKCLGKMSSVAGEGRTVIFVSHNMSAVSSLCDTALHLEKGRIRTIGPVDEVIRQYMKGDSLHEGAGKDWLTHPPVQQDEKVRLMSAGIRTPEGTPVSDIRVNQPFDIVFRYQILGKDCRPVPNIHLFTSRGEKAFGSVDTNRSLQCEPGIYTAGVRIPENFLNEDTYTVGFALSTLNPVIVHASDYEAFSFEVLDDLDAITRNEYKGRFDGVIRPLLQWKTQKTGDL